MNRVCLSLTDLEGRITPNAYTVENLSDDVNTANSLRWCIKRANDNAGADSITFDAAKCKGNTIKMTSEQYEITGPLSIDGDLGNNDTVKIEGLLRAVPGEFDRHFVLLPASKLELLNLRLTGGRSMNPVQDPDPQKSHTADGGSILVTQGADLSLYKCIIDDNAAEHGGAIYARGAVGVVVTYCTISDNLATGGPPSSGRGGAIFILTADSGMGDHTDLVVRYSDISRNKTDGP